MVKLAVVVAAMAIGVVFLKDRLADATGGATTPQPATAAGVPSQFREILASRPDPASILRQRGALPGLGAIRKLAGHSAATAPEQPAPFADVGSARELRAVRADIRRDLTALNHVSASDAQRTLSEVYSASVLAALGR